MKQKKKEEVTDNGNKRGFNCWLDRQVNWISRKKLYVVKQFEYEGDTYLYAAFYESLKEESEEYLVVFLRKIGDSELEVVKEDDELNDMLLARVTGEFIAEEIEKN